ncbi:MAG: helix-turn-helix transcriptional regulator [Oscillospiraceae bacterium]|nr:helix-turn-helix transcriptional regulator [Oscillospiraceae bacterium]
MFDNRLTLLREEMNLSKKEMAEKLNLPYTTYCNYENDEREPNSETLINIAQACDVSVDYLLGLTPIRHKENEILCELLGLSEISVENLKKYASMYHKAKQKDSYSYMEALDYLLSSEHFENFLLSLSAYYEIIKYDRFVGIDDDKERNKINMELNEKVIPFLDKIHLVAAGKYDIARLRLEESIQCFRYIFNKELLNQIEEDEKSV